MKPIPLIEDAGVGRAGAPIGTRDWADSLRLHSHGVVKRANEIPAEFKQLCDFLVKHRAWTLMNKPDGTFFATFEEFCAHRRPWGWGHPYEKLKRILELVAGETTVKTPAGELPAEGAKVVALANLQADRRALRERDDGGRYVPTGENGETSQTPPGGEFGSSAGGTDQTPPRGAFGETPTNRGSDLQAEPHHGEETSQQGTNTTSQTPPGGEFGQAQGRGRPARLRAVLRASAEVQSMFQAGLIGEKVAARLGPRGSESTPVPEELQARVEEATKAARRLAAEAGPLDTLRQRLETQKKINAEVLRILGPGDPVRAARSRGLTRPLERALAEAHKLDAGDLKELVRRCLERLPAEHAWELAGEAQQRASTATMQPQPGAA
ncbi:MAG: hypothetical protein MUF64_28235 [Polyangiaceae bacterium]|nr:hypothetical protein [Polyangiaceae bacterium]